MRYRRCRLTMKTLSFSAQRRSNTCPDPPTPLPLPAVDEPKMLQYDEVKNPQASPTQLFQVSYAQPNPSLTCIAATPHPRCARGIGYPCLQGPPLDPGSSDSAQPADHQCTWIQINAHLHPSAKVSVSAGRQALRPAYGPRRPPSRRLPTSATTLAQTRPLPPPHPLGRATSLRPPR